MFNMRRICLLLVVVSLKIVADSTATVANQTSGHDSTGKMYCGQRFSAAGRRIRRVVGGSESRKHSWPWQVLILNGTDLKCGGSIISPTWIFTAAHCVDGNATMLQFYAGRHQVHGADTHQQKLEMEAYFPHPKYRVGGNYTPGDYDMALIKLKKPITFSRYVHPVCLPDAKTHFGPGHVCALSGWGYTNLTTKHRPNNLRDLRVPIVAQDVCNSNASYGGVINKRYFCAGVKEGGKDGCIYDSGGPLMCSHDQHTWYLTGMIAWGIGCAAKDKYGVYLNITEMVAHIITNITDLPTPYLPTFEATTSTKGANTPNKHDSKEKVFVAIICALCAIIIVLLAALCTVHFYGKGCRMSTDKQQEMQSKSPKLIEANGKHNQQVSYV